MDLSLLIDYDIIGNTFCIESNIKKDKIAELLQEFLIMQMGKETDKRRRNELDLYTIDIHIDLSEDIFYSKSNCNNDNLRDGILLTLLQRILS